MDEERQAKLDTFLSQANLLMENIFGEDEVPGMMMGVLLSGPTGDDDVERHVCAVSTNLTECSAAMAVRDMVSVVDDKHLNYHAQEVGGFPKPVSEVPEGVRADAFKYAESLGFTEADVQFIEVTDMSDLEALPETDEPERG